MSIFRKHSTPAYRGFYAASPPASKQTPAKPPLRSVSAPSSPLGYCPACGTEITDGLEFCNGCGFQIRGLARFQKE